MKIMILIIILLLPLLLISVTRTVSLNGTQQYTNIQSALDACNNNDIVEVFPGEYFEHLNTGGRSVTIQSRYNITQSEGTIDSTIIHASVPNSCLKVNTGENVVINGFTMMNNSPLNLGQCLYGIGPFGGGVEVYNRSSIQILNCNITNCIGLTGGIYFEGISFYMSNSKVYNNHGAYTTGGIKIYGNYATSIVFDSVMPNSIYNNTSRIMDLSISNWPHPMNIILSTFSVILTEPDYFFLSTSSDTHVQVSVQSAFFNLINHDIYVSPSGDNSNSGLTPDSPLQTIAYAVKIIESDSLNPKTIHLAPGVYNFTDSNQYFPFSIKSNIRLTGDNMENTFLDSEQSIRYYLGVSVKTNINVENITFAPYISQQGPIGFGNSENIVLRNLKFEGTFGAPRIQMTFVNNIVCENIVFSNAVIEDDNYAFRITYCDNVKMNNIIIDNLDILGMMANVIGFSLFEADVVLRNSIISNCSGYDVSVLLFQNIGADQSNYNLEMSNMLIFNNQSTGSNLWSFAPIFLSNRYQRMKMNNCTIANNNGTNTRVLAVTGDCDVTNSIFYNPGNFSDVVFWNDNYGYVYHPTINYSLLNRPLYATNITLVDSSNVIVNTDPLFLGIEYYDIVQPEYYQLSANSPCINAGTPDTTGLSLPAMDLAGNYRVWNNRIDMGCYEYGSEPYTANEDPEYPPLPDRIMLSTYPNPVYLNGSKGGYTFIEFTLPEKAKEQPVIDIYNLKGQKVRSIRLSQSYNDLVRKAGLSNKEWMTQKSVRKVSDQVGNDKNIGEFYSTVWDCKDDRNQRLASGIYIVKVTSGNKQAAIKMTILK